MGVSRYALLAGPRLSSQWPGTTSSPELRKPLVDEAADQAAESKVARVIRDLLAKEDFRRSADGYFEVSQLSLKCDFRLEYGERWHDV